MTSVTGPVTIRSILEALDEWAPFASAESWDNVGLLVGTAQACVQRVMTSLDVTPAVVEQAAAFGAQLLISHHPVLFRPISRLLPDHPVYLLARQGIAAIAAHTNLDSADGGVNDGLAALLGLSDVRKGKDGLCRIGSLEQPLSPARFVELAAHSLGVPAGGIQWQDGGKDIQTVGVCSGAGGDYLEELAASSDAVVTGELHYHEWPLTTSVTIVAAGHYYTEIHAARLLAQRLREAFPMLSIEAAREDCPYRTV